MKDLTTEFHLSDEEFAQFLKTAEEQARLEVAAEQLNNLTNLASLIGDASPWKHLDSED